MKAISLVGFMGAGKSAVGAVLAEKLKWPYFDLDHEIERREGRNVYRIFSDEGEGYFRQREREVLRDLAGGDMVLSVGGGAFTDDDNINLINNTSRSVWLKCPLEICLERCARTAHERPLFSDPEQMAHLYDHRLKYYKRAEFHVDSGEGTPEEIAAGIMKLLGLELTT